MPVLAQRLAPSLTAARARARAALIGGIAGAALGTGYGAYKTKNDCGTIFGDGFAESGAARASGATVPRTTAAYGNGITVYSAH